MECVFCRIIAGELPSRKVYEDEGFVAFHDIRPKAPVHVLVVPKEHVEKLSDYPDTEEGRGSSGPSSAPRTGWRGFWAFRATGSR